MDLNSHINYSDSIVSLAVPVFVISMVIITRRVALSLLFGIILGGILLFYNEPINIILYAYKNIASVFYSFDEGKISFDSIYVFGFLIFLGILTQIILHSGAISSFVNWAHKRVSSPAGSELIAFFAGIIIFIDDYFNTLAVGQISKSLNDANKSSRERLAYIIDSTSAPVCILVPISSWGAYIIGIIDKEKSGNFGDSLLLLINSVFSNYYAWFAIVAVFLTIIWQINLPTMQKNVNVDVNDRFNNDNVSKSTPIYLLIVPIVSLVMSIFIILIWNGIHTGSSYALIDILSNTNIPFSLFYGGLFTVVISFAISIKYMHIKSVYDLFKGGLYSILPMIPAIIVLILAWSIGPIIRDDIQTGVYLANVSKAFITDGFISLIPAMLFIISAFIAFSTGTSWGTFAIMIPIGFGMLGASDGDFILGLSAILAGSVFGDHSSPISDTTILSSTGAGCSVQSHFITQLPYVASVSFVALISFIIAGLLDSVVIGHIVGLSLLVALFYLYKKFFSKEIII